MGFFNHSKTTGDNNLTKMHDPVKKMNNALTPKLQGQDIGTMKFKMPENAGEQTPRAGFGMIRSSMGAPTKPLPKNPTQALPPDTGLLHSQSPTSALAGIKKKPAASSIGKHLF